MGLVVDERGTVVEKLDDSVALNERLMEPKKDPKNQKNFTPIAEYKPTGNFVYDKEFFEKIEKRMS